MNLSVCMIVKNESQRLPGLFACLPLLEIELIVVDTGSHDQTCEIAIAAGAKVFQVAWEQDFALARNISLSAATRSHVLWLDADDRVTPQFWEEMKASLYSKDVAYRCIVRSPRDDGSCESFLQIRLIPNGLGIQFEGRIHEQLGTSLHRLGISIQDTQSEITHLGYESKEMRQKKSRRNAELLHHEYAESPQDSAVALQYGNALCQLGEFTQARDVYWTAIGFTECDLNRPAPQDERLKLFPALIAESLEKSGELGKAEVWHTLARTWAPNYLRSGYFLAKQALQRGDSNLAFQHSLSVLSHPPQIGLVACDNHGVRQNAFALLISMAMSSSLTRQWVASGHQREELTQKVVEGIHEFVHEGRIPLELKSLVGFLVEIQLWPSLLEIVSIALTDFAENVPALEDAFEGIVMNAPIDVKRQGLSILKIQSQFGTSPMIQSGVLMAFHAMLEEECAPTLELGKSAAWQAFKQAIQVHPHDPTVAGQMAMFVDRHRLQTEALSYLKNLGVQGEWLKEIAGHFHHALLSQGQRTQENRPLSCAQPLQSSTEISHLVRPNE